jgi:hypothetical protein
MATMTEMSAKIMSDLGKTTPEIRMRVESLLGSYTVDLLSLHEGRHSKLRKRQDITLGTTRAEYKLNNDFNTPKSPMIEVNSDGVFVREVDIVDDDEFYHRQSNSTLYPGVTYGRIEQLEANVGYDGKGSYLILGKIPDEAAFYKLFYFRLPLSTDVELIRNPTILEFGVKGSMPDVNPTFQVDQGTYFNMRAGFKADSTKLTVPMFRNSRASQRHNTQMNRIGQGY